MRYFYESIIVEMKGYQINFIIHKINCQPYRSGTVCQ